MLFKIIFLLLACITSVVYSDTSPVILKADKVDYDQHNKIANAKGSVEVIEAHNILIADRISYFTAKKMIFAYDNIAIFQEGGNVLFAHSLEIDDRFTNGKINDFKARLSDGGLLAARKAVLEDKNLFTLSKAAYSACPICGNDKLPWQIKAHKVIYDKAQSKVTYKHAFLEFYDIPIIYTPYFFHYTNNNRKSGMLPPKFTSISGVGKLVKIPYYFNIAQNIDSTLTIIPTTEHNIFFNSEFRHLTKYGSYRLFASLLPKNKDRDIQHLNKTMSHIEGLGDFDYNNNLSSGFDFKVTSHKNYLRRYDYGKEDYLTSKAYVSYMKARNYSKVESIYFQDLKEHTPDETAYYHTQKNTPLITPYLQTHIEKHVLDSSTISFEGNGLVLTRAEGNNMDRGSATIAYKHPYLLKTGQLFTLHTSLRNDIYHIYNRGFASNSKNITRTIPEVRIDFEYPLARKKHDNAILIEPLANFIIAPYGHKSNRKVPNEDSRSVELSDDNLYRSSKFSGYDRVENSSRANYGINVSLANKYFKNLASSIGQTYRRKQSNEFHYASGMKDHFSDLVGRVSLQERGNFGLFYKYRLSKDDFTLLRNEISTRLHNKRFGVNVDFISYSKKLHEHSNKKNWASVSRKQIKIDTTLKLSEHFYANTNLRRDLTKLKKGLLYLSSEILYKGDCIDASYKIAKDFTKIIASNNRNQMIYSFEISLKNLGKYAK